MFLLDEIIYPTFGWVGREGLSGEVAIWDLNNKKEPAMWGSGRTTFQGKRTAVAKEQKLKQAWQVQGLKGGLGWSEQSRGGGQILF